MTPFDIAEGRSALMLKERKVKGFVTGSIAEKHRKQTDGKEGKKNKEGKRKSVE